MPDTDGQGEDGIDWLASQLGGGAKPARPDEFVPRKGAPRRPKESSAGSDEPGEAAPKAAGFLWGLKPTTETDPEVASTDAATLAASPATSAQVSLPQPPEVAPRPIPAPEPAVGAGHRADPLTPAQPADLTPAAPAPAPAVSASRSEADLEPAPWWTTPAQSPLVPTAEESAAARRAGAHAAPVAAPTAATSTPEPIPAPAPAPSATLAMSTRADSLQPDWPQADATNPAANQPESRHARRLANAARTGRQSTPTMNPTAPRAAPTVAIPAGPAAASAGQVGPGTPARRRGPSGRSPSRSGMFGGIPPRLLWTAGALLAVIVLVGLFFLGRQLVGGTAPAAVATSSAAATPTASRTPTAIPEPTAPQPVGVHKWNTLFGGECLQPYVSPWEEDFTVADCAAPHAAQLVYRGTFPGDAAAAFPGEEALASQINLLCSATGVIDLAAAAEFPDVQVQGSYPITQEQWAKVPHSYYCFVNRSSGDPLSKTIAGPGPAPAG